MKTFWQRLTTGADKLFNEQMFVRRASVLVSVLLATWAMVYTVPLFGTERLSEEDVSALQQILTFCGVLVGIYTATRHGK